MEYIGILRHRLVSFLAQSHPSDVSLIIVFDKVEFLFDDIGKIFSSGFFIEYLRFIPCMPLVVPIPPVFDMGEGLKEHEGDIFTVEIFLNNI